MLFLARGLSLSFLLPAPLEATASRPSPIWHRAPSFGNVPYIALELQRVFLVTPHFLHVILSPCSPGCEHAISCFQLRSLVGGDFSCVVAKANAAVRHFGARKALISTFGSASARRSLPPPLLLRFCFSYPQCRPPSSRRFEFRTFSRSRPP